MTARLEGYAAAVLGMVPDDDAPARAGELAAVEQLVSSHRSLRSALTDTAVPASSRRAILDDLLDDRVRSDVRRLAGFAAATVAAPDVIAALAWLSHRAHMVAEGQEIVPAVLGHQAARQRVGGFAAALCDELPAERLDDVEDDLFRFARTVETTPALRAALTDRDLPAQVRRGVVADLIVAKVQPPTARLVDYAVLAARPRDIVGTLFWLVDRVAEARGWKVALVAAARDVDPDERERLSSSLGRLTGWPVELQVVVDPALLAGVRVRIGDLQVDATARGRLDLLEEHMNAAGWEDRGFGGSMGGGPASGPGAGDAGGHARGQSGVESEGRD